MVAGSRRSRRERRGDDGGVDKGEDGEAVEKGTAGAGVGDDDGEGVGGDEEVEARGDDDEGREDSVGNSLRKRASLVI